MIDPLGYNEFTKLWVGAKFVITDSGGIQEETTYMKIPCLTIRDNTERPVTINIGSSVLVGSNRVKIIKYIDQILENKYKASTVPLLWDGHTSKRIIDILNSLD